MARTSAKTAGLLLIAVAASASLLPQTAQAVCTGGSVGGFTQYLAGQLPDIILTSGATTTKYIVPHYVYFKSNGGHCGILARSTVPGTSIADTYGCSGAGCPVHPAGEFAAVSSAYGGSFTSVVTAINDNGVNYIPLSFDGSAAAGTQGFLEIAFATTDIGESTPPVVFARVPIYVESSTPASAWGTVLSTTSTISGNRLVLSHPYLDGNPSALLFVSHVYNPIGRQATYWNHPIAVAYDQTLAKWTIENSDDAPMIAGLGFSYRIDPTAQQVCVPAPSTGSEFTSTLDVDDIGANSNIYAMLLVTPVGGPAHVIAVKYTAPHWGIVYADQTMLPAGACFNVKVIAFSQYLSDPAQPDISGKANTSMDIGVGEDISSVGENHTMGGARIFFFNWSSGNSALPILYTSNLTPMGLTAPAAPDTKYSALWVTDACFVVGCVSQHWGLRHEDNTAVPSLQRVNVWAAYTSGYPPPHGVPPRSGPALSTFARLLEAISSKEVISALVGAAAAFFLVAINDWRRYRVKAFRSLPARIRSLRFFTDYLVESIDKLLVQNPATMDMTTHWMRPPSLGLSNLAAEVDDILDVEERTGAQAVCFLLETLDKRLRETERIAATYFAKYQNTPHPSDTALADIQRYRDGLQEARETAKTLGEICLQYRKRPRPWFLNRPVERVRAWLKSPIKGDSELP